MSLAANFRQVEAMSHDLQRYQRANRGARIHTLTQREREMEEDVEETRTVRSAGGCASLLEFDIIKI